ncbi:MAG: glycosyltransferase family 4 protein [Candidatus Sumerlaeota bacterium]|nr:glycosyltransferase family 4 protein [Candidatus Sumerlaeota bacterium]
MAGDACKDIVFVVRRFDTIGGVERHVQRLARELSARGIRVTVFTEAADNRRRADPGPGVRVVRFGPFHNRYLRTLAMQLRLLFHLPTLLRASLIHCHDSYPFALWYLPFRFLLFWKRVYVTFHGYEGNVPPLRQDVWLRRVTEWLTRGNICVGDYIQKWYGTKADYITYGAIDPPGRTPPSPDFAAPRLCFLGRLAKDTGILTYLEALSYLKTKGMQFLLAVCGDGVLRSACEELARRNGLSVEFHGAVERPEEHLAACDVALVSGYLAILEAMAHGRLVLAVYDNELKRDYLEGVRRAGGHFLMAGGAGEAASHLERLPAHPEEALAMAGRGASWARGQTWAKLTDMYLQLWAKGE